MGRAALADLADLPDWPLLLSDIQAGAFLGLSREQFRLAVDKGTFPPPITAFGTRRLWHREALRRTADRLAGLAPAAAGLTAPGDHDDDANTGIPAEEWEGWSP